MKTKFDTLRLMLSIIITLLVYISLIVTSVSWVSKKTTDTLKDKDFWLIQSMKLEVKNTELTMKLRDKCGGNNEN